jgi:MFS family permease
VMLADLCRTTLLLQLQFLISPINSTLCQMLDGMAPLTYSPRLGKSLFELSSPEDSQLTEAPSFQLLFGKFYTFFSIKYVYLIAIAIFELGSLICGVAPNSISLIIGRAVAGIGSAGIFSGALIIVAYSVPLVKRPMYSGFIGAMYGIVRLISYIYSEGY